MADKGLELEGRGFRKEKKEKKDWVDIDGMDRDELQAWINGFGAHIDRVAIQLSAMSEAVVRARQELMAMGKMLEKEI